MFKTSSSSLDDKVETRSIEWRPGGTTVTRQALVHTKEPSVWSQSMLTSSGATVTTAATGTVSKTVARDGAGTLMWSSSVEGDSDGPTVTNSALRTNADQSRVQTDTSVKSRVRDGVEQLLTRIATKVFDANGWPVFESTEVVQTDSTGLDPITQTTVKEGATRTESTSSVDENGDRQTETIVTDSATGTATVTKTSESPQADGSVVTTSVTTSNADPNTSVVVTQTAPDGSFTSTAVVSDPNGGVVSTTFVSQDKDGNGVSQTVTKADGGGTTVVTTDLDASGNGVQTTDKVDSSGKITSTESQPVANGTAVPPPDPPAGGSLSDGWEGSDAGPPTPTGGVARAIFSFGAGDDSTGDGRTASDIPSAGLRNAFIGQTLGRYAGRVDQTGAGESSSPGTTGRSPLLDAMIHPPAGFDGLAHINDPHALGALSVAIFTAALGTGKALAQLAALRIAVMRLASEITSMAGEVARQGP